MFGAIMQINEDKIQAYLFNLIKIQNSTVENLC